MGRRSWAKQPRQPSPRLHKGLSPQPTHPRCSQLLKGWPCAQPLLFLPQTCTAAQRQGFGSTPYSAVPILGTPEAHPRPPGRLVSAVGERGRARSAPGRRREDSPAPLAPHGTCLPCRAQSCVTAAHSSAHNKQRLIATAVAAALQRCGVFGWEPTCPQNAPGETLGISAVSSRVTRATHNYAGVSRGRGNASSFKLSLEYRGLVLTMQQRF